MKKLLSILLALIMCFGLLVSCGNEEFSSSESHSKNDSQSEDMSFSKEIIPEENSKYYCEISKLYLDTTTSLNDFDPRAGEFYTLIKSYDGFLSGKENQFYKQETIESVFSPGFFEEYHLIKVTRVSANTTRIFDIIGLRDAYFENGALHISKDEATYSQMFVGNASSIGCRYFAIPKSELNLDGVTVDKIEIEENLIYLEDDFYRNVTSHIKPEHGERLVITAPQEYDELKAKYGLTASLVTNENSSQLINENSVYIAIYYGERAEDALSRGYHLETDGNKIILTEYVNIGIENPTYSAPYFKFVKINKSNLEINPSEISEIIVKEITTAPKLEIVEQASN